MKKIIGMFAMMFCAALAAVNVSAAEPAAGKSDLMPMKVMAVAPEDVEGRMYEPQQEVASVYKLSQKYEDDWDVYSSNYYYNFMGENERALWDKMDEVCLEYLTKEKNANMYRGYYCMPFLIAEGLTENEAAYVALIFRYSNPQYYFLNSAMFCGRDSMLNTVCAFTFYDDFGDGSDRKKATAEMKKQIDKYEKKIAAESSEQDKLKVIHDSVCEMTTYNYDAAANLNAKVEEIWKTQTAYSAFCMGTTVCAGYAQAFEILANGAGIDAIVVTSKDHEWNKVRVDDSWYNIDCTWDDNDNDRGNPSVIYYCYARSDEAFATKIQHPESHREEKLWEDYLPACTLDTGSEYDAVGTFPVIDAVTEVPVINVAEGSAKSKVTITCATKGAAIYYTLDGSVPSPSSTKSYRYTKTFSTAPGRTLTAIAVCDASRDSETASASTGTLVYKIKFNGNGATSGSTKAMSSLKGGKSYQLSANGFKRTGYAFDGWNTEKNGSGKSYKNKQSVRDLGSKNGETVTLYAQWKANKYTVKFSGNGATGGSMKKMEKCKYGTSYKLSANKFKRKGYTFNGWNTKKNGKGKGYKNKGAIKNLTSKNGATVVLYAQWKKAK